MAKPSLTQLLNKIQPLPISLIKKIDEITCSVNLPKRTYLLREGNVCDKIYFIKGGLARSFFLINKKEVTTWIMRENDIVFSSASFFTQTRSVENIVLLENSKLEYLNFSDLQRLYSDCHEANIFGRILTEYYYSLREKRTLELQTKRKIELYDDFLKSQPDLVNRVRLKYVASFLGVSNEGLSRIRARFSPKLD